MTTAEIKKRVKDIYEESRMIGDKKKRNMGRVIVTDGLESWERTLWKTEDGEEVVKLFGLWGYFKDKEVTSCGMRKGWCERA